MRILTSMGWWVGAALLVLASAPSRATPMSYGTGLPDPAVTIDFSELADGVEVGSFYAGQDVVFGGLYVNGSALGNTQPPSSAPSAANFQGSTTNSVFTLSFAVPVSDAAFFLYTDGQGATITSSLGGGDVESVGAGQFAVNGEDFFGFTGSLFDLITVSVAGTGSAVIDNVQAGVRTVPEPGSVGVLLAGLAGLVVMGGRRRI